MRPRILLTGFEPFGGETLNPSLELLNYLEQTPPSLPNAALRFRRLPVVFSQVESVLRREVDWDPQVVLLLGQAAGRDRILLEKVAVNWVYSVTADNEGDVPSEGPIDPAGPSAFLSPLPLRNYKERLMSVGVPAEISFTAGTYVCNWTYYLSHQIFPQAASLFIHLPSLPTQALSHSPQPSMSFELMEKGLRALLDEVSAGLSASS